MRIQDFHETVQKEFGRHLEHVTPASAREFVHRVQAQPNLSKIHGAFELDEPKATLDEIMRDFFVKVLEAPRDDALIMLWTTAFDLYFYVLGEHLVQRYGALGEDPE